MTTQLATPERSFSLNMPTGHGLSKLVEIPSNKIDRGLIFARPEAIPAAQNYLSAADHLLEEKRWNSGRVFVTSPVPGDGKTCTAFNLAWALSCRNKSVLLVELNFARPQFRSLLGNLRVWHGIDCALRGAAKPGDSMFSIGPPGLNVCAVRDATSPHHRNQHFERLDAFLDWCGERYNWLILDCPPVLSREWSPSYANTPPPHSWSFARRELRWCKCAKQRNCLVENSREFFSTTPLSRSKPRFKPRSNWKTE